MLKAAESRTFDRMNERLLEKETIQEKNIKRRDKNNKLNQMGTENNQKVAFTQRSVHMYVTVNNISKNKNERGNKRTTARETDDSDHYRRRMRNEQSLVYMMMMCV